MFDPFAALPGHRLASPDFQVFAPRHNFAPTLPAGSLTMVLPERDPALDAVVIVAVARRPRGDVAVARAAEDLELPRRVAVPVDLEREKRERARGRRRVMRRTVTHRFDAGFGGEV